MCDKTKVMGLLAQITKGLIRHGQLATAASLGDRTKYIGMSDIGAGVECLRKAVGNKLNAGSQVDANDIAKWFSQKDFEKIEVTLSRQLILQRGHWFEDGILEVLYCNTTNLFSQLEIDVEINDVPIKAHLDFVVVGDGEKPTVRVLELKSCDKIPKHLYTAYELQLYGQIGLLSKFWNEPVFNLKSETGEVLFEKLSFPDIVQQAFGFVLPEDVEQVDLEGWVLALSMKTAKAFGPYVPSDVMTELAVNTAERIWLNTKLIKPEQIDFNSLPFAEGFNPLCDFCDYMVDCPKFSKLKFDDENCHETLKLLSELKEQKKEICSEIEHIESQLKEFYSNCNLKHEWIEVNDFMFRCCENSPRKIFDKDSLKVELIELIGENETNQLFEKYTKTGAGSKRLYVKQNNGE